MHFTILGQVQVSVDGRPIELTRAQRRAVLAYLLLHTDRQVPVDEMIEALWGGAPPLTAKTQVHNAVSGLRTTLRKRALGDIFRNTPAGYRIDVLPEQLDLAVFHDLVRQARDQPAERAARTLRMALETWRGIPLGGVAAVFVGPARAQLEALRGDVLESVFDHELNLGRHHEVIDEISRALATFPLRQNMAAQLMLALSRSGRQADALAAFRDLRDRSIIELGMEPGVKVSELHRQILNNDPGLAVTNPGLLRRFLPRDLPDFTGREEAMAELDHIADAAADASAAVVISAIAGIGGVGKTALAVHWSHRISARYPDGQLYINLRGFDPGRPVATLEALTTLLRALGMAPTAIPHDMAAAAALYRSTLAGQQVLVLLDNAQTADQVRPLLPPGFGSLAIVTSRHTLIGLVAKDGARSVVLPPLTGSDAIQLLAQIIGQERVNAEPAAAAELCAACGRLPLALRLAAANLLLRGEVSIAALVAELNTGDRLSALTVADDPNLAIRPVFDRSYALLSTSDSRTFRFLGLVPGPELTADAVAALCDCAVAEAHDSLQALRHASLVTQIGSDRVELHDLLKYYAKTQSEALDTKADRDAAVERYLSYYVRMAGSAVAVASPQTIRFHPVEHSDDSHRDASAALTWLGKEQVTLLAAIEQAAQRGPLRTAWHLADILRGYFWIRRDIHAWEAAAGAGLRAATALDDPGGRSAMLLSLAIAHRSTGRMTAAIAHFEDALTLAGEANWQEGQVSIIGSLGIAYAESGMMLRSLDCFKQALQLSRSLKRTANVAVNLGNIGGVLLDLGDLKPALDYFTEARELYEQTANRVGEAIMIANLGITHIDLGHLDTARDHLERALKLHQNLNDRSAEAVCVNAIASLHLSAGRLQPARRQAELGIRLSREIADVRLEITAMLTIGRIRRISGEIGEAVRDVESALARTEAIGHRQLRSAALDLLAQLRLAQHDRATALTLAKQALSIADSDGFQKEAALALTTMAEINQSTEDARAALAISRRTGFQACVARAQALLSARAVRR